MSDDSDTVNWDDSTWDRFRTIIAQKYGRETFASIGCDWYAHPDWSGGALVERLGMFASYYTLDDRAFVACIDDGPAVEGFINMDSKSGAFDTVSVTARKSEDCLVLTATLFHAWLVSKHTPNQMRANFPNVFAAEADV